MNKLPKLPQVKNRREAKSSLSFKKWLMSNKTEAISFRKLKPWIEMKDSRGKDRFYLRELKDEQIEFGKALKWGKKGILVRTEGIKGMPDYKFAQNEASFVVIKYPKGFVVIDIETMELEKTKAKSMSWERGKEISIKTIE